VNTFHPNDKIVSLSRAPNPALAHIWENALRQEGIHCRVVGDFLDAGIGDVSGIQPEIWVSQRDIAQAQAVLGRLQPDDPVPDIDFRDLEWEPGAAQGPAALMPTAPELTSDRLLSRQTAVAFDLSPDSLNCLHTALPGWNIEVLTGATETWLTNQWDPGKVELFVVEARPERAATLALCRFLTRRAVISRDSQSKATDTLGPRGSLQTPAQRAHTPLLVLVPVGAENAILAA